MKIGEVWTLKDKVNGPTKDQINLKYSDEFQNYTLVPAIKIRTIKENENPCEATGWNGDYYISYYTVWGLTHGKPYINLADDGFNIMSSGCLFRNYDCVHEMVSHENR